MGFRMPDTEARRRRLQEALNRIVERLAQTDVIRAILFGSFGRGSIHSASDIDLILIRDDPAPFLQRLERARHELNAPVALDLLVYTPAEFEELSRSSSFVRRATREGRVVYEASRPSRGRPCAGPGSSCA